MEDLDPNISNGTCYSAANIRAPSRFIPCGNAALGHVPCCESGDNCLASNACYNGQFGVTYLTGCTDVNYQDGSCPSKDPYQGYTWVGLSYCNGTSNEWIACQNTASTVTVPKPCWCPETSRVVAFSEPSVIPNQVSLPAAEGQSVSWFPYFTPTYNPLDGSTSTSLPLSTVSTSPATPQNSGASNSVSMAVQSATTSASQQNPSSTGLAIISSGTLSTGAKAGIGVGVGVGGIAIVALVIVLLHYLARHKANNNKGDSQKQLSTPHSDHLAMSEQGEMRSPAWSGQKSELAANESTMTQWPSFTDYSNTKFEAEGSPGLRGDSRPLSDGGYEVAGKRGTLYEMPG